MTWIERAEKVIPGGTQTFSKARSQFPANAPSHIWSGQGAHVWGSDQMREYVDWTMGLGAISLGYRDPDVDAAVREQLLDGTIFGLAHPIEVEFAEEVVPLLPWPDAMVRYGKNGSDATGGAVRAARAITGRDLIVSSGYHGWLDWTCPNKTGIPAAVRALTLESGYRGEVNWPNVAAIIIEPDQHSDEALRGMRQTCTEKGALLIFDEVLTGFRVPGLSYAKWKGVTPDLICFAKAIANGFPLSVIAGPEKYMRVFGGDVGYSFTFGGEALSLAAGLATVRKYRREPVVARLSIVGGAVRECWNRTVDQLGLDMPMTGLLARGVVKYPSLAHRTLVSQEMIRRGILWTVGATACYAHTEEDIDRTTDAIRQTLAVVASVKDPATLVEGPVVSHPYRAMTP